MHLFSPVALCAVLSILTIEPVTARDETPYITVCSAMSTTQSGFFDRLLPAFTAKTGMEVFVASTGGQALETGERGECDVVFAHDKPSELKFVKEGHGIDRHEVMYSDYLLIGPTSDPAKVGGGHDILMAFAKVAAAKVLFLSRADSSATDITEKRLWQQAGIEVKADGWYRSTGSTMHQTLDTAAALHAYTLSDRASWLSSQNHHKLAILVQGDKRLLNQYSVILVNPARHPEVKQELGTAFIDWLISPDGQRTIASYKINGEQLFFPNALPGS